MWQIPKKPTCNIKDSDAELKENLESLSLELATNYCTVSFGEDEKKTVKLYDIFRDAVTPDLLQDFLKISKLDKPQNLSDLTQHRNILVIGAGATSDSFKCIPLGQEVIARFEEKYKSQIEAFPALKERYDNYKKELELQDRKPDFENMLALYSELILTPRELRDEISELFNFRYSPSLFYEILAHMFKHSFIDVIINFNFDEILDQAIEEELGKDNYHFIVSDGDCVPINNLMVDGRLKIPIYIKPHGTVSHKSTLRFTKRHYLDIPEQIKNVIINLIEGKRGEIHGRQVPNIAQVNIISVGFNMESLEFGDIINEHLPEESKIYHICFEKKEERCIPHFVKNVFKKFYDRAYYYHIIAKNKPWNLERINNHIYKRIAVQDFNYGQRKIKGNPDTDSTNPFNELTTPFAEVFSYLWRNLYYKFNDAFKPRSIGRHEIINYFFYQPYFSQNYIKYEAEKNRDIVRNTYETSIGYFLDRTIVEIAIAINRNNGIIEISQLLGDRAGLYYKKYRDRFYEINKTNKGALSIYDLLSQFQSQKNDKSVNITYIKNVFELDDFSDEERGKINQLLKHLKKHGSTKGISLSKRMTRWESKNVVTDKNGNQRIENGRIVVDAILENFDLIFNSDPYTSPVTVMVLYRLFRNEFLSEAFLDNFKNNYFKFVYNGNIYDENSSYTNKLIREIARLFIKSSRQHYYSIRPKYNDPKNFISESFSKTKILHTILSVEYSFINMFKSSWDVILMISETGSMLNCLESDNDARKSLVDGKKKKIIIINSFEAIKQLDKKVIVSPNASVRDINNFQNEEIYKRFGESIPKDTFFTYSLPSVRHNHHMILFLKRISDENSIDGYNVITFKKTDGKLTPSFSMSAAMYIYRKGFSNHLNPLFIGMAPYTFNDNIHALTHDFKKLLRIFTITLCRALAFEDTKALQGLSLDINGYQTNPEIEQQNIHNLISYLEDVENVKFIPKE